MSEASQTHASDASAKTRPPFTLKVASTKDEIEACYDIRIEVFSVEQGFPLDTEIDEWDPTAVHFLLTTPIPSPPAESSALVSSLTPTRDGLTTDKPIGTIRFVPEKGKLTRLALDKEYRKYGFGAVLVRGLEDWVTSAGKEGKLDHLVVQRDGRRVIRVKSHSQIYIKPFYAKHGYVPEGDEFDEDGAPHQLMVHEIEID
ncbi:hypothetical protein IAU60_001506 [Kwoniella sp. DSM 27419]